MNSIQASATQQAPVEVEKSSLSRDILSALLSALLPGLGHLFKSCFLRAAIFFSLAVLLIALQWLLRLPFTFNGLILSALFTVVLALTATCDAFLMRSKQYRKRSSAWFLVIVIPLSVGICQANGALLWRLQGFRAFNVPSGSMEPTIDKHESIAVDACAYDSRVPRRGEVIVFRHERLTVVKRVIAVGGDIVQGYGNELIVNGRTLPEPYANLNGVVDPHAFDFPAIRIPDGKLFVVGDHRAVSLDSRDPSFGFIDQSDVTGKVLYIVRSDEDRQGMRIE